MTDIDDLRRELRLTPHPAEGGHFAETYRSGGRLGPDSLDPSYPGPRSLCTAIYYLITPGSFSALHRLRGDEIFHFYLGDPVEMLQLPPRGEGRIVRLGHDILAGMRPQVVVPAGVWQGSRLIPGGRYALLGTTMAPGFDYEDYEAGEREVLQAAYPEHAELIAALTRQE